MSGPVEPVLTPEQEDAFWAIWDALQAAKASGNALLECEAIGLFLDWQISAGLLTREELRAMSAPHLLDVIGRADEMPEGRKLLEKIRDDFMELLNGDDYNERTAAALFILSMDAVQKPRQHSARRAKEQRQKADWVDALRSIETRTDLACLLLWTHAYGDAADADNNTPRVEDARESWRAARAARAKAQGLLEHMGQRVARGDGENYLSMRKPGSD